MVLFRTLQKIKQLSAGAATFMYRQIQMSHPCGFCPQLNNYILANMAQAVVRDEYSPEFGRI